MAHELDFSTGKAAIAFTGDRSGIWHGLGNQLDPSRLADIPYLLESGGLAYSVTKAPLFYRHNGDTLTADNVVATVRSDTGALLGTVSDNKYNLVQPADIVEFFRDWLASNQLQISTLGALRGGRIVWALAKLGPDFDFILPGNDKVESYVRLQTSFDGTRSTSLVPTTIRQVCANTERMIENSTAGKQYITRHSAVFNAKALQAAFGLLGEQQRITAEVWNNLAARKVSDAEARAYFVQLLDLQDCKPEDISGKARNQLQTLASLYLTGPGSSLASARGTAYGLLQAVTCYVDHHAATRDTSGDGKAASRAASSWFGKGADVKEKARTLALALAA
jgi:phage/plasmid-like protein (TIGR03299 family)